MLQIPSYAQTAIETLEQVGYTAYIVGGCVRDALLGKEPNDFDITTSAQPNEVAEIFAKYHVIDTGLKHGTLTVVIEKVPVEITTYRIDGEYTDNRHPASVRFTDKIEDDLARRDFTVNAMAYSDKRGLVDCFGGMCDLENGIIRCVGNADARFGEDALRILRALRFAATLGFEIESETKQSIIKNRFLLKNIAAERIQAEFFKLICGKSAVSIIDEYRDVFAVFMPQIEAMFGFEQNNKHHCCDVWEHSLCALSHTDAVLTLRLAALFHDIGKPDVYSVGADGEGHFYAHPKKSVEHTRDILNALKCDNATKRRVLTLIEYHDAMINPNKKSVKKWLSKLGEDMLFELTALQAADSYAHAEEYVAPRINQIEEIRRIMREVIAEGECFSLKELAVNGSDMAEIGFVSRQIGNVLKVLLEAVISGEEINDRQRLMNRARDEYKKYTETEETEE